MTETPDYTVDKAAQRLAVSRVLIYKLIKEKKLQSYKLGRCTRITHESLEALRAGGVK